MGSTEAVSGSQEFSINVEQLSKFDFQVSGHINDSKGSFVGVLKCEGLPAIMKPFGKRPGCYNELNFYSFTHSQDAKSSVTELRRFIPRFHGIKEHSGEKYFILEDLTHGYALPCVMDIKIGKQTHEPNARPEKALAENKKYLSTKPIVGFCLPGAKFYSINAADWIYFDKHTGNSLQPGDLGPAILTFLNESKVLCGMVISCLKELLDWFETKNSHFAFFATSILLTYDASCLKEDDAMHPPSVLVKMIDFAHTLPVSEEVKCLLRETSHLDMAGDPETNVNFRDENYIFGLKNLIRCLEEVISR